MMVHTLFLPIFTAAKDEKYFNINMESDICNPKMSKTLLQLKTKYFSISDMFWQELLPGVLDAAKRMYLEFMYL